MGNYSLLIFALLFISRIPEAPKYNLILKKHLIYLQNQLNYLSICTHTYLGPQIAEV